MSPLTTLHTLLSSWAEENLSEDIVMDAFECFFGIRPDMPFTRSTPQSVKLFDEWFLYDYSVTKNIRGKCRSVVRCFLEADNIKLSPELRSLAEKIDHSYRDYYRVGRVDEGGCELRSLASGNDKFRVVWRDERTFEKGDVIFTRLLPDENNVFFIASDEVVVASRGFAESELSTGRATYMMSRDAEQTWTDFMKQHGYILIRSYLEEYD